MPWSPNKSQVKFGKLVWTEKSFKKWTHGSPDNENENLVFTTSSAWSPSQGACNRRNCFPHFTFSMSNKNIENDSERPFGTFMLFSLYKKADPELRSELKKAVLKTAELTQSILTLYKVRKWGKKSFLCFNDTIPELELLGILQSGWGNKNISSKEDLKNLLKEEWEELS